MIGRQIGDGQLAFNLRQDVEHILGQGVRVSRAIEQYAISAPMSAHAIRCAIQLRRDLSCRRLHTGGHHFGRLLTQLKGVGHVYAQQLAAAGLDTFDKLRAASTLQMEQATRAGDRLKAGLCNVPKYAVDVAGRGGGLVQVALRQLQPDYAPPNASDDSAQPHHAHLVVGRLDTGTLLLYRKVRVEAGSNEQQFKLSQSIAHSVVTVVHCRAEYSLSCAVLAECSCGGAELQASHRRGGRHDRSASGGTCTHAASRHSVQNSLFHAVGC